MSRYISPDQQRRAALHAALGDPVRLAIAEALSQGDRSAKDLGATFEMATNLLAHHLGVLEDAGVIQRRRSEGDRRRTYVQLCIDDPVVSTLVLSAQLSPAPAKRVVFVCTHNSARSQLAAAEWRRSSHIPAASAGTHPAPAIHRRTIEVARKHGLRLQGNSTAHVDDVLETTDLVVAVCDRAHEEMAGGRVPDALHWSIPDPVRPNTNRAFEKALGEISARVARLTVVAAGASPDEEMR